MHIRDSTSSTDMEWKYKAQLSVLNFLTLNRAKPGIFIAPFLLMKGWREKDIGLVMFINGIVSLISQTPAGMLADMTKRKRTIVAVANVLISVMCLLVVVSTDFSVIVVVMSLLGVGNALAYPALYSITLGLVGQAGIMNQVPINETSVHAGNAFFAFASGLVAYLTAGDIYLFRICAGMGVAACLVLLWIDPANIDFDRARGMINDTTAAATSFPTPLAIPSDSSSSGTISIPCLPSHTTYVNQDPQTQQQPMSIWRLASDSRVIVFLVSIMLFHFANASMLPLLAQFASLCVMVAQVSMIFSAAIGGYLVPKVGTKNLFILSFAFIPLRGLLIAGLLTYDNPNPYILVLTQVLDGAAGGLFGVIAVLIAENLSRGTGHFSVLVGSIKTVESLGAPFSHLLGELLVDSADYPTAYGVLSIAAILPVWTYWRFMPSGYRNAEGIIVEDLSIGETVGCRSSSSSGGGDTCDVSESGSMDNSRSRFIKKV